MAAEDGQFHGHGQGLALAEGRFDEELPIGEPRLGQDADSPQAVDEGLEVAFGQPAPGRGRIVLQERIDAVIVVFRGVEGGQEAFVAGDEGFAVHGRDEVQAGIRVFACGVAKEPVFGLQPPPEPCFGHGGENADHGRDHPDFLDETDLLFEDAFRIAVESDDESAHDLQAVLVQGLDRVGEIHVHVLLFAAFLEAVR